MFSFLNSAVLFAAAAALIPLIIHLFSRRRVKVVEFSSLKHLKAMQRRQVRRLKIRQLLLLILRMLIILAVVLAFARPTTKSDAVGTHAAVAAVLLVDNSASMDRQVTDGNLFELTRQRLQEVLNTFDEGDQVALIPLCRSAAEEQSLAFSSAGVAREQLNRLNVSPLPVDFGQAFDRARRLLSEAASINKELYIVSDRQRTMLPEAVNDSISDVRVVFVELPMETSDNVGVVGIEMGNRLVLPGREFEVVAQVRNYSSETRRDLIASLFLDGRRIAQTDLSVAGGDHAAVRFAASVSRTGLHSGYVEISDDQLPADNRHYFSFSIPEQFNILIISDDASGSLLELALSPSPLLNKYWSIKQVSAQDMTNVNLHEYDLIVLGGAPTLATNHVQRLQATLRRGGALLVTYGAKSDTAFFNRQLAPLTGVRIDQPPRDQFSRSGYYDLGHLEFEHPVFSVFDFSSDELPTIRFFTLPKLTLAADATVLARFSGDRPALVEYSYDRGRVLTFGGIITAQHSDIATHAFFVPFVSRCAEYLTSRLSGFDLNQTVGRLVRRSIDLDGALSYPLEVTRPDSSVINVPPEEDQSRLSYLPQSADQVGVYRTHYLGREVDRFALNLPADEGNLGSADIDRWAGALNLGEYHSIDAQTDPAAVITELRSGRELWQLFVWLALGLMVIEMLLARSQPARG